MKYDVTLVRYGELSLKSTYVRRYFESILIRNIKKALQTENIAHTMTIQRGRIYLITDEIEKIKTILPRIFGIVSFSPAVQTTSTLKEISAVAQQLMKNVLTKEKSFAIRVTRIGTHPFSSQDVAIRTGNDIVTMTRAKVDLNAPDIELFIEIRDEKSFLFTKKIRGPGGLPSGTQGTIAALIENPVSLLAAWYLMRRGCNLIMVNTDISNENAISSFLRYWYTDAETINIDPAQEDFFKRLSDIGSEKRCNALVTGHSLDEPGNSFSRLQQIKKNSVIPILSPLIALTKEEIQLRCRNKGIQL
jgi:thiamine biosynthesis protein ThiI